MLFFLLALIYIWNSFSAEVLLENAEIALVGFHTLFNILGVILVLPFTRYFAWLIEYLVPLESNYLYHLDAALPTKEPKLALIASQQALQKVFQASLEYIGSHLNGSSNRSVVLVKMEKSIDDVQEYIDEIVISESKEKEWEQLIALLHGVNHLERLAERCEGMENKRILKHIKKFIFYYEKAFEENLIQNNKNI